jgi:multiple sugar transport system substrate-binding protein
MPMRSRPHAVTSLALSALIASSAGGFAQSAAERAVEAAQEYRGSEITVLYEAGLQALDATQFAAARWEELTGIRVNVVESPVDQIFTRIMQAHRAGTAAYDVLNVIPNQMPDLALAGALEPLDDYVERYGYAEELEGIAPVYRDNWMRVEGTIYGLPDDGDVLVLYYRRDIFEDEEMRAAFEEAHGRELAPPRTWEEFREIGQFITDRMAPEVYGAVGHFQPGNFQYLLQQRFRDEGGRFFDPDTMEATINSEAGVRALEGIRGDLAMMPPGVEQWGFVENLNALLAGDAAMSITWPPVGRWAAGYGVDTPALDWVPESQVRDKIGYALPPNGNPELAVGFSLALASNSQNKDAAYLFMQWLNSEETSLERVQLPFTLRDPFRTSHFEDEGFRNLWPHAGEYLDTLKAGSESGMLDLSIIQIDRYEEALRQAISRLWAGDDIRQILDDTAASWDALTEQIGVETQRRAYLDWSSKPNAYPGDGS